MRREYIDSSGRFLVTEKLIHLSEEQFVYHGLAICPEVRVDGLLNGYDYIVSYGKNRNAGTALVFITGIGRYTGTVTKTYQILPAPLSNASVKLQKKLKYTGKKRYAKTTLTYLDDKLQNGKDYMLSYKNNKNPGYATVIITGKGNYHGQISLRFKIIPKTPESLKVKSTKERVRILHWKKHRVSMDIKCNIVRNPNLKGI